MNSIHPHSRSLWRDAQPHFPKFAPLNHDLDVDVLVVGGGITGITTAHLLGRTGRTVALLERYAIAARDTSHTTAHLTYMTDSRLYDLVRVCGRQHTQTAWEAGRIAMKHIEQTVTDMCVDVELAVVPGYLAIAAENELEEQTQRMRKEVQLANEIGFDLSLQESLPVTGMPGLLVPDQMKFHPLKYLQTLVEDALANGVGIYEHSSVEAFGDSPLHASSNGHRIRYGQVIIATHVPIQGNRNPVATALFQTKLAPYSTYAIAARIPRATLPEMIWSDTATPFNYIRVGSKGDHDTLIMGGEDHKTGQVETTSDRHTRLQRTLSKWVPAAEPTHRWSGQVVETVDGLPYIGPVDETQFIATGYSGNGMTFGTAAAIMARDWLLGLHNPWEKTFDPGRTEWAAIPEYITENKDFPAHLIKDRFSPSESTPGPMGPGQGNVIKSDGKRLAMCVDREGHLHRLSAICPHLGCTVMWNEAELTWDCPCHGSRFAPNGAVMAGPAETNLKTIEL